MNSVTSIENIIENNPILRADAKNVLLLSRVEKVSQLIKLVNWSIECDWNDRFNKETIEVSRYILSKINEVLWINPEDIWDSKVLDIALKLWERLKKTRETEKYIIWLCIEKYAHQIKWIHLRYERYTKHKENRVLEINGSIDHLTWLLNRKSMNLFLNHAINNKKRNGENYWIIMIDIDHFKRINDTYWHNTWDIVIKEISKIFKNFFRVEDSVSRWWWEEFLILMRWWEKNVYLEKINKLRQLINDKLVELVNAEIKSHNCVCDNKYECKCENEIKFNEITISIWITELSYNDCISDVTKRADKWLYEAKNSWRNKAVLIDIEK